MRDPIEIFLEWYKEAEARCKYPEPMYLATATKEGIPSVRTVLYRGLSEGCPRFFTNYHSRKGEELNENPNASLLFYWEPLERQVRFEGFCEKLSVEESDEYFRTRPRGHQLNAWASPQSQEIQGRTQLLARRSELESRFFDQEIPRPPHWGGYRLVPSVIELWVQEPDRFHQRYRFSRTQDGWAEVVLAP